MSDQDTLARTLFGEAEAGDAEDAIAIGCVIVNRTKHEKHWPNNVTAVCLQPYQFSCWNANDPNRQRIMNANEGSTWYGKCCEIAANIMSGAQADITNGATHYYANYIKAPSWAEGHTPCFTSSEGKYQHFFFNDIDTKPPVTAKDALDQTTPLSQTGTIKTAQTGVGVATAVAVVTQVAPHVTPYVGIVQTMAQYAPWAIVAILVLAIGGIVLHRMADRTNGVR